LVLPLDPQPARSAATRKSSGQHVREQRTWAEELVAAVFIF
jgi:hypothetical protein